jgi:tRNA (guanine-N(7)-)-methyltransferase
VIALGKIKDDNLSNLKILNLDAREVLENLKQNEISVIYILFPDPWPKKSQQKNRLLSTDFIKKCLDKVQINGKIIIATDWGSYAEEIQKNINDMSFQSFHIATEDKDLSLKYEDILNSTFARRAKKEGRDTVVFEIYKK